MLAAEMGEVIQDAPPIAWLDVPSPGSWAAVGSTRKGFSLPGLPSSGSVSLFPRTSGAATFQSSRSLTSRQRDL